VRFNIGVPKVNVYNVCSTVALLRCLAGIYSFGECPPLHSSSHRNTYISLLNSFINSMMPGTPSPTVNLFKRASATADLLRRLLPEALQHPTIAIVCGSGLGGLAETIHESPKLELPYEQVPGFPINTGMLVLN
jgi:hypothetical protein